MDEFNTMWGSSASEDRCELTPQELNEETPEYVIRNGIAKYENLANILLFYFHAKHGESMADIVQPREVEFSIRGK